MKKNQKIAIFLLVFASFIVLWSALEFIDQWKPDVIIAGPGVTETANLSDYFPELKGEYCDTTIYFLEGDEPGGTVFILGGTHPNEPSSMLSTVMLIENAVVTQGRMIIIPQANLSGYSHNDPQEGSPRQIHFTTPDGIRAFRYGSRATNPIHQWPDPDIYINQFGQSLSGSETRNLNRGYPGDPDGNYTEKVCYGIMEVIRKEECNLSIDLHEASPEYPVINAIVAHERAIDLASIAVLDLQLEDLDYNLEISPPSFRGLTHREWGDYSNTMAILMETANASQGRIRGRTDETLVLTGKDKMYIKAAELGRLYVPYDESGHPIEERVGRHLTAIKVLVDNISLLFPDKAVQYHGIPAYQELLEQGYGAYLIN
ncbi:MAG: succinylglutamate desuccinylase [Atribacterota bacterium]|nr:succinylglutamate desuccinylase [Atribacterota bacterium]MDD4896225.1 succinylglutamate desuccinylase [Atribacterota bacterium]MDD5637991.1 succinylglutamate desuccinylase [Atribacterota bacterium]